MLENSRLPVVFVTRKLNSETGKDNTINLLGKTVGISPNLLATIAKKVVKLSVKKTVGLGIEI